MAPFVQQLWHFQCPGLPTAFYSSQLQGPLHPPTACSSTRPGARASWVWAAGWRGEGQGQPTKVKSTRVFHDLDSASVLDFKEKNRKSKHRSDHVLGSSPSPNPLLSGPGGRWNGEVGEGHFILCPEALSPWFLLAISEPPRAWPLPGPPKPDTSKAAFNPSSFNSMSRQSFHICLLNLSCISTPSFPIPRSGLPHLSFVY